MLDWTQIKRVIQGTASSEEVDDFNMWLKAKPEHREFYDKVKFYYKDIESAQKLNEKAGYYDVNMIFGRRSRLLNSKLLKVCASLAAVVAVVAVLIYSFMPNDITNADTLLMAKIEQIPTRINSSFDDDIKLITENGDSYQVNHIEDEAPDLEHLVVGDNKLSYVKSEDTGSTPVYHTISVPHGKTFTVKLSDGTTVYLNTCSTLKYPIDFKDGEKRIVTLTGEAFFEVAKRDSSQFIVTTDNVNVVVHGTEFNVSNYGTDIVETVLVEGLIGVQIDGTETKILPNQKIDIRKSSGTTSISNVNVAKYISWRTNVFTFEDVKLRDVIDVLERWYNVDVRFDNDAIGDLLINCNMPRSNSIEEFFDVFKNTGRLNYRSVNNTYYIR